MSCVPSLLNAFNSNERQHCAPSRPYSDPTRSAGTYTPPMLVGSQLVRYPVKGGGFLLLTYSHCCRLMHVRYLLVECGGGGGGERESSVPERCSLEGVCGQACIYRHTARCVFTTIFTIRTAAVVSSTSFSQVSVTRINHAVEPLLNFQMLFYMYPLGSIRGYFRGSTLG